MKEVVRRSDLVCQTLDDDFDSRVEAWKKKYEYTPQSGTITTESDDKGFSIESVTFDATIVPPISEVTAVAGEDELIAAVKSVLGEPNNEQYTIVAQEFGQGDLLYKSEGVILIIECKRVKGRSGNYRTRVRRQAMKYAGVFALLRPKSTVYAITYTEYGFEIVDVHGEPRFPAKFAEFLDVVPIHYS